MTCVLLWLLSGLYFEYIETPFVAWLRKATVIGPPEKTRPAAKAIDVTPSTPMTLTALPALTSQPPAAPPPAAPPAAAPASPPERDESLRSEEDKLDELRLIAPRLSTSELRSALVTSVRRCTDHGPVSFRLSCAQGGVAENFSSV